LIGLYDIITLKSISQVKHVLYSIRVKLFRSSRCQDISRAQNS